MDEFRPIDSEILEELEVFAAMKKVCYLKFEAENGGVVEMKARIIGIYTLGEVQYLKTEEGLSVRLDKIIQVEDKTLKKNC